MSSFDDTFLALRPRLVSRARTLTGNPYDADDAVQEVYHRLARGYRDRFTRHPAPYAYAFHALRTLIHDNRRRRARDVPVGAAGEVDLLAGRRTEFTADVVVRDLMTVLTPTQRRAVFLVDVQGHSLEEAAAVLDVDRSAVHRTRARALRRLRRHLGVGEA